MSTRTETPANIGTSATAEMSAITGRLATAGTNWTEMAERTSASAGSSATTDNRNIVDRNISRDASSSRDPSKSRDVIKNRNANNSIWGPITTEPGQQGTRNDGKTREKKSQRQQKCQQRWEKRSTTAEKPVNSRNSSKS